MTPTRFKQLSHLCFALGFVSIVDSIAIWRLTGGQRLICKLMRNDLAFLSDFGPQLSSFYPADLIAWQTMESE